MLANQHRKQEHVEDYNDICHKKLVISYLHNLFCTWFNYLYNTGNVLHKIEINSRLSPKR